MSFIRTNLIKPNCTIVQTVDQKSSNYLDIVFCCKVTESVTQV